MKGRLPSNINCNCRKCDDIYYLSVYLKADKNISEDTNRDFLKNICGINEILYAGNTTPCAIIVVTGKNIVAVPESDTVEYVSYAFFTFSTNPTSKIPENGNRTYAPNAVHARKVLRYAAGLYDLSDMETLSEIKEFLIMSDTDFDGKITAKGARSALRIAADLEDKVEFSHATDSFRSNI